MKLKTTLCFILAFSFSSFIQSTAQDHYVVDRNFGETCGLSTLSSSGDGYNPNEVFKLSTGKYMVTGDVYNSGSNVFYISFAQFNNDGTVDSTFGTNGLINATFNQRNTVNCALQDGDKIYVAGYEAPGNGFSSFRAYVARFLPDGNVDTSFNAIGTVLEPVSVDPVSCSFYTHLALDANGRLIAFGYESANINGGSNSAIARRYNADGTLDSTFHPAVRYPSLPVPVNNYYSPGISYQDSTVRFVYISSNGITSVKLDSVGELVASYGTGGFNETMISANGAVTKYFGDQVGNIYAQTQITNATQDIRAVKLDPNGDLDTSFSGDGVFDLMDYPGTNLSESGYTLHFDSQNRLWSFGAGSFAFTEPKGIVYRFDTLATYDSTLEGTGYLAITEFPYTTFRNTYFENDNEIVINTITNGELGLMKLRLSYDAVQILNNGSDILCDSSQTILSINNLTSCYTYQWKKDGIDIATVNDSSITVDSAGVYTVVAIAGTDTVYSAPVSIIVIQVPVPGIIVNGDTLISDQSADSYQWYINGNPVIVGGTDSIYVATLPGSYTLQITINGCSEISLPQIFSSIQEQSGVKAFTVYTQLRNNEIVIVNAGASKEYLVEDLTGRLIMRVENPQSAQQINFSSLGMATGNYMVRSLFNGRAVKFTVIR